MASDSIPNIETDAQLPAEAENDGLKAKQHKLGDRVDLQKYKNSQNAADEIMNGKLPVMMFKFKPPGSA